MRSILICALLLPAPGCGSAAASSAQDVGSLVVKVTAGPTCPVQIAGGPDCPARIVQGARLRLEGPSEATIVTDAAGVAHGDSLPEGVYHLAPQPVTGLMSTPAPRQVMVTAGETAHIVLIYDTGIR